MNFPVSDLQISGVQDNGSAEGIVKSRISSGELILLSPQQFNFYSINTGTANVSYTPYGQNADGQPLALSLTTPAGIGTSNAIFRTQLYGTQIGVRIRRLQSTPQFSVVIDGRAYGIPLHFRNNYYQNELQTSSTFLDEQSFIMLDDKLSDRKHDVEVIMQGVSGVSQALIFLGFVVERRAGYKELEKTDTFVTQSTLTTSFVAIPVLDAGLYRSKGVRKIFYTNTDAVNPQTVTVQYNTTVIYTLVLAAGSSSTLDFGPSGVLADSLSHKASANSTVNFTTLIKQ